MESSNPGARDGASPRQQILEKEAIKKTTARKKKEINRNCRKEMQQKKPPSHKFIKKPTRKGY